MMNSLLAPDNATLIDEFCDSLWLEDGLSKNSLDAYRRDMRLFARLGLQPMLVHEHLPPDDVPDPAAARRQSLLDADPAIPVLR